MQISKYFTLEEMISSAKAKKLGIDNSPSQSHLSQLIKTCTLADKVREYLGHPMLVLSGYRSAELNAAVSGSPKSAHMRGEAIDFICPKFGTPDAVFNALQYSGIKFDQLILEYPGTPRAWVHIGFTAPMRWQFLTYNGKAYITVV